MKVHDKRNIKKSYLEERVKHLEDVERFVIDALEMAASLGDFQHSINRFLDVSAILHDTKIKIEGLIPFEAIAFYLVDENTNDFVMKDINNERYRAYVQGEVDAFIEDGTFAWSLRERRPVIMTAGQQRKFLLHVMATAARIRGICVCLLPEDSGPIQNVTLSLFSIIMLNSANAIESSELYRTIREINSNLERIDNYRILFEAAPDGVEVLDAAGQIVDSNDFQKKLIGYHQEDLLGTHTSDYFSESNRSQFLNNYSMLKEKGYWEGEVELVTRNGEKIAIWRKEKAIYEQNGKFLGAVVYNRDISGRKRDEEEKQALEARLKRAEKMEALGFLAGGVAHDLNNVLGGLVSYPELLLMQLPHDSPMRKSIMTIQKSGEKAAAIVEDLLTLARRGVFEPQVVNLNDIISDYLKSPEYERLKQFHPDFSLSVHLDPDLMNIKGSPVHLSRVIMNLMSNAVEALPTGGQVTIMTEYRYLDTPIKGYDVVAEGDYAVLSVSDNGHGISAKDLDKIFEPFYTKKIMGKSGTGLGLAVIWGTVKDHRGYIDVRSQDGKGSVFTIYFPITIEASTVTLGKQGMEQYMGNGEKILVVDDVMEQRDIATSILSKLSYDVCAVSCGLDAISFIQAQSVDLVILDMIMDPGLDGLETYERILEISPGQKAIIVSGFSETDRVRKARALGAGAYVRKPYRMEVIGLAVREALKERLKAEG